MFGRLKRFGRLCRFVRFDRMGGFVRVGRLESVDRFGRFDRIGREQSHIRSTSTRAACRSPGRSVGKNLVQKTCSNVYESTIHRNGGPMLGMERSASSFLF